ncbi:MAG: hypothetical protein ACXWCY_30305, partial [Burkholderiales bacterium]
MQILLEVRVPGVHLVEHPPHLHIDRLDARRQETGEAQPQSFVSRISGSAIEQRIAQQILSGFHSRGVRR